MNTEQKDKLKKENESLRIGLELQKKENKEILDWWKDEQNRRIALKRELEIVNAKIDTIVGISKILNNLRED